MRSDGRELLPGHWSGDPNGLPMETTVSGGAWPSANLALFAPYRITAPTLLQRFCYATGNTTGNIDIGIYNEDGTLITSTGAVALSGGGANAPVFLSVTAILLAPGDYFLAMSCSSATASPYRSTPGSRARGVCQMASAHPLPSTATFAATTYEYFPVIGFSTLASDL